MNKTIKKLDNGDFQVEDNTTVYGIRKMLRPKHDYWDQPIKRNRKEQLTPEELEYRHAKNRMDQMEGWPLEDKLDQTNEEQNKWYPSKKDS